MRLLAKIAIGLLVPIVGYFTYDSIAGHWLVRQLCAKDGGLRIHETTFADGYLDESETNPYSCLGCFWKLAKHEFKYVDVRDKGRTPGYFRFSLAQKGDPRCEPSKQTFMRYGWARLQKSAGIPEDQCVAVEALPGRPAGAVLTESYVRYPDSHGRHIEVSDVVIRETTTNREIAHLKNYHFFVKWGDIFNWAPSQAAASCQVPLATYQRIVNLEPLLDRTKSKSAGSIMEDPR